ncbi:MAG TPA: IS110 family transposase [Aquihabitans sp.]|jgi:transposase|nr:IS110 family transposase [Aquihabitans sp.]
MLADLVDVVIGVDTHKHTHTAAVVTASTGAAVEDLTIDTDPDGYAELLALAGRYSGLRAWSIEGTGGYGAGLARFLAERGELVIELDRPNRPARRNGAKSDPLDAVRAGREALARKHLAQPRAAGERAALAVRLAARRSAVDASTVAQRQMLSLITASPEAVRARFRGCSTVIAVTTAARLRMSPSWDMETRTYAEAIRDLARRALVMQTEAAAHEKAMLAVIRSWRPDLLDQPGVGAIVAATVLCAWSHPGRCRSDAAFASLAGVAPIPASSGLTTRYRLNRCGDRQLNRALHVIVISRLRYDARTRAYAQRRRAEGRTDREIKRCLKRYVARQLFRQLENPPSPT